MAEINKCKGCKQVFHKKIVVTKNLSVGFETNFGIDKLYFLTKRFTNKDNIQTQMHFYHCS